MGMVTCCSTSSAARPGHWRDDLHVVVGHIGIGFDGEIVERDRAPDEQKRRQGQNNKAVVERGIYQCANHETFSSVILQETAIA